jgi:hypothetical protein
MATSCGMDVSGARIYTRPQMQPWEQGVGRALQLWASTARVPSAYNRHHAQSRGPCRMLRSDDALLCSVQARPIQCI